jgi:hypothetical protein
MLYHQIKADQDQPASADQGKALSLHAISLPKGAIIHASDSCTGPGFSLRVRRFGISHPSSADDSVLLNEIGKVLRF